MSHTPGDSDQELGSANRQRRLLLQNGAGSVSGDSNEVSILREENCRLLTTLVECNKTLENTKLRYGTVRREYYAAKKRLKRMGDKLQALSGQGGTAPDGSESGESVPVQQAPGAPSAADVDDDVRKKWKEPNVKAAVKLKAAIGVHAYQSLIKDGELQLPSLRTISRYVDTLKKAGLRPNYDFNVRDTDTVGRLFVEEDDSGDVDHNRNQQAKSQQRHSRDVSDAEDPVNFSVHPDISFYPGKIEPEDMDGEEDNRSELFQNGSVNGESYHLSQEQQQQHQQQQQQQQHHQQPQQQQTLTSAHIEFLKSMTGFRKKWTPFELRTCMDIRRIIGSKEYDSLRKNDGMPLPSAKTLRKYKHAAHLDGVDVMSRKRSYREMLEGLVTPGSNGATMNGTAPFGDYMDDIMNAEEPEGFFDINGLTEQQIDFLQALSSNTKGFSDFELQKTLEFKNEVGGKNYEILRKQECLHIPTLVMLKRYEHENGLEDLSAMVVAEDLDDDEEEQEPEQDLEPEIDVEVEPDTETIFENGQPQPDHYAVEMNGTGEDSHMGIFEHHSIFDKDDVPSFDMSKLSQQHMEFLNTLPENPKRWTPHMINSALDIKNEIGTRDYELLRRQGIPLPAARTLRRHKDIKSRVTEGEAL
ncbi:uncharacterized protein LOC129730019 [Wyeomyia smithii]|uniref:uncharacterized protein LOC129730019 n=1 Tax=Wyeomyia smithii TaxID=174621 RepID=UPI0024681B56|nr:uncharacterized protein LOC129730019 [Wyeomyia smithii]